MNKYTFAIEFLNDNFTLSFQKRRIWHIKNQHANNCRCFKRYIGTNIWCGFNDALVKGKCLKNFPFFSAVSSKDWNCAEVLI